MEGQKGKIKNRDNKEIQGRRKRERMKWKN
jgi:hypothetical protein